MVRNTRAMLQVTSALLGMNVTRKYDHARGRPKMFQKQPILKVIIHAFGLSQAHSSECHGMPPRDLGGHWKRVMWLGTNMWMPLCSFRGNFGFHEK